MRAPTSSSSSWRAPTPLAVEGIDRAIERAVACVEAGADMIFPEAMTELAMYRRFKDAVGVPVLANITEFGATPLVHARRARRGWASTSCSTAVLRIGR